MNTDRNKLPEQVEQALRHSQNLLDNLSMQVPGILFQTYMTPDGAFSTPYASSKSHDIYELSPEEIAEDISILFNRFHPEDRDRVIGSILESAKSLLLWDCEYRVILPRQGLKWLYGTAQPQALDDGRIVWYGIIMDVSDRKKDEELLRLSKEKFSTVFHTSPDAVTLTRCGDGKYLAVNEGFTELTGYGIGETTGNSAYGLHVWADPVERQHLLDELAEHGVVKGMEARFRRKDGSVIVGQVSASSIEIDGDPCLLSIVRDITQHKQTDRAIRDSEKKLRSIMDAMPIAIAITDGVTIEYINSCFVKHFGYTLEETPTDREWFLRAYPDPVYRASLVDAWKADLVASRNNGTPMPTRDVLVTCKDGSVRNTLAYTQIVHDRILVIFTDITEREMALKELLKIQKLESLGVLAGGLAHDFNNILTGIIGNISLAKMFVHSSQEAYKSLERAEKASWRASDVARQLLVFAKGDQPVKKLVNPGKVVEEAVSLALSGTPVRGEVQIPASLHAIEADEGQISQAFHNVVINAVQSMPSGGTLTVCAENVVLSGKNSLGLPAGDYVMVSCADEGCGISEDDQKKIFDPYFSTKAGGTGLGLASTYAIISKHGGHVGVSSSLGNGALFTMHFPSTGRLDTGKPSEKAVSTTDQAEGTVLVMDDDEMVRELAAITLAHAGYTVQTCINGDEAIALYRAAKDAGTPFTATIMDLTIPGGMGGVEAARRILAYDPDAVLIVSSGYSEDPVMANFKAYGFCAAIEKPYGVEAISQTIRIVKKERT
jgi:PAS domain S-box-containing protein